jgi:hypothetical protein
VKTLKTGCLGCAGVLILLMIIGIIVGRPRSTEAEKAKHQPLPSRQQAPRYNCERCRDKGYVKCPDCYGDAIYRAAAAGFDLEDMRDNCDRCGGLRRVQCPVCRGSQMFRSYDGSPR